MPPEAVIDVEEPLQILADAALTATDGNAVTPIVCVTVAEQPAALVPVIV